MKECLDEGVLQSFCDGELTGMQAGNVTSHLAHCQVCAAAARELVSENDLVSAALAPEFQAAVPTERLRRRIDAAVTGLAVGDARERDSSSLQLVNGWFASLSSLFAFRPTMAYAGLVVLLAFASILGIAYWRQSLVVPVLQPRALLAQGAQEGRDVLSSGLTTVPTLEPTARPLSAKPIPVKTLKRNLAQRPTAGPNPTVARVKLLPGERSYLKTIASLDSTIKSSNDKPMRPALRAEYERNLALVDRALAAARNAAKSNPNDPDAAEFVFAAYQSKVDLLSTVADARVYNRQP